MITDDSELLAMVATFRTIVARFKRQPEGTATSKAEDEMHDQFARILKVRAVTPQGMLAKLEAYPQPDFSEPECVSVWNDLRVLCGLSPVPDEPPPNVIRLDDYRSGGKVANRSRGP
jgi:hypothetical protein